MSTRQKQGILFLAGMKENKMKGSVVREKISGKSKVIGFLLVILLSIPFPVLGQPSFNFNLSGTWNCDDGGNYYFRQIGDKIWWYGEPSPQNPAWTNVAHGEIYANKIVVTWADVPKGRLMNTGHLELEVVSDTRIVARIKTGGFGGSAWTRSGTTQVGGINLTGDWYDPWQSTKIIQADGKLTVTIGTRRGPYQGEFTGPNTIKVDFYDDRPCCTAVIEDANTIRWSNGIIWKRK